ncbi:MAG: potB 2 [Proteobacteria bacterium]|nr:potB 2 [Pseudomonadota bacterium]
MTFRQRHLALPVAVAIIAGCLAPLAVLVAFSFYEVEEFDLVPAFSFRAWGELAVSATDWFLIGKAVLSGLTTTVFTVVLGYPVALALTRLSASAKGLAVIVLLTPLYTGEIVRIYAWRIVLGGEGLVNTVLQGLGLIDEPMKVLLFSPFTIGLVLTYNNLPFMVLAIWVSAEMVDRRLIEAARDLGARPVDAFFRVILPLTVPGLAAGSLTVFALSAGEMLTPSLLGGTSGSTAMALVDNLFGTAFDWPLASALALALLATLFLVASAMAGLMLRLKGARAVIGRA